MLLLLDGIASGLGWLAKYKRLVGKRCHGFYVSKWPRHLWLSWLTVTYTPNRRRGNRGYVLGSCWACKWDEDTIVDERLFLSVSLMETISKCSYVASEADGTKVPVLSKFGIWTYPVSVTWELPSWDINSKLAPNLWHSEQRIQAEQRQKHPRDTPSILAARIQETKPY